jgi:hypothetical protein
MYHLETAADSDALERVLQWFVEDSGFERHHAVDGVVLAEVFRPNERPSTSQTLYVLGLDIAWWFWVDDRSDKRVQRGPDPVDFARLMAFAERKLGAGDANALEERSFVRLSNTMKQNALSDGEHAWWLATASRVFSGMLFEQQRTADCQRSSYSECIEYGLRSTAVPNILATASLAYDLRRFAHPNAIALNELDRLVFVFNRLLNDLYSADVERTEGLSGRSGNTVLEMEQYLSPKAARAFVTAQASAYEQIVYRAAEAIGPEEPLVSLAQHAVRTISGWYNARPLRYVVS